MPSILRQRSDTAAAWASVNPVIPDRQLVFDATNSLFKIGNGVDNYSALSAQSGAQGPEGEKGDQGDVGATGAPASIMGSDTVANIKAKPHAAGACYIATDTGTDDAATPVAEGDGLSSISNQWINIGQVKGDPGEVASISAGTNISVTGTALDPIINNTMVINNTVSSTSTTEALSANQGKALNDGKINANNPVVAAGTITEDVYAFGNVSGSRALEPDNGSMQSVTVTGTTTFTDGFAVGQAITLRIQGGDTRTITWPTITWVGGIAPTLTAADEIVMWKDDSGLKGSYVGSVA